MSEQEQVQASTNGRRTRQKKLNDAHATTSQRPTNDDKEAWKAYWDAQDQPWRTEPEIDTVRKNYLRNTVRQWSLSQYSSITHHIEKIIYPFKDIKLNRADIEWLLATQEFGFRQADWSDESHKEQKGLDLRGIDLRGINLSHLPLKGSNLSRAHLEKADLSFANLEGVDLGYAHLEYAQLLGANLEDALLNLAYLEKANLNSANLQHANLNSAQLQYVDLSFADLKEASLWFAQLQGANIDSAHLEGANLRSAQIQGANLNNAYFDSLTQLNGILIGNKTWGALSLADNHWNNVNIAVVDWSLISELGNEQQARKEEHRCFERGRKLGPYPEDRRRTLDEYRKTVRAYRQLSVMLRNQGLNEDAARFTYRAQLMQRKVYRFQRGSNFVPFYFSLLLDLMTGYGYKPWRSFAVYIIVIVIFAALYYYLGSHLFWNEAIVISMTAFHGRGFFPEQFQPDDPQALVAAIEAFVGLLIEVTFIATLTQRLFGK